MLFDTLSTRAPQRRNPTRSPAAKSAEAAAPGGNNATPTTVKTVDAAPPNSDVARAARLPHPHPGHTQTPYNASTLGALRHTHTHEREEQRGTQCQATRPPDGLPWSASGSLGLLTRFLSAPGCQTTRRQLNLRGALCTACRLRRSPVVVVGPNLGDKVGSGGRPRACPAHSLAHSEAGRTNGRPSRSPERPCRRGGAASRRARPALSDARPQSLGERICRPGVRRVPPVRGDAGDVSPCGRMLREPPGMRGASKASPGEGAPAREQRPRRLTDPHLQRIHYNRRSRLRRLARRTDASLRVSRQEGATLRRDTAKRTPPADLCSKMWGNADERHHIETQNAPGTCKICPRTSPEQEVLFPPLSLCSPTKSMAPCIPWSMHAEGRSMWGGDPPWCDGGGYA